MFYYMEAYTEAKAKGRKMKQNVAGAEWKNPDEFATLTREQALAKNWVVSDEVAATITPTKFKETWNTVRREFTNVKDADTSELYKKLTAALFRG